MITVIYPVSEINGTLKISQLKSSPEMKRLISAIAVLVILASCNNNTSDENAAGDPSSVHPPSETIPDSTKLVNDSVIVADTTPGNNKPGTHDDSSHNR
jgi:hypothetical protein